jgi:hypothetical protein
MRMKEYTNKYIPMNKRQTNKMYMYKAVEQVCQTHADLFAHSPAIREIMEEFKANLVKINAAAVTQSTQLQGFTVDKKSFRERIVEMAQEISGAVTAYAIRAKNNHIRQVVAYSPSRLKAANDQSVINIAQVIHDQAKEHLEAVSYYGVTAEILGQFQTDITHYSTLIGTRRQQVGNRVTATQNLDTLFTEIDVLLEGVLDGLLLPFRKTQPAFYSKYRNARKFIALGKRNKPEPAVAESTLPGKLER